MNFASKLRQTHSPTHMKTSNALEHRWPAIIALAILLALLTGSTARAADANPPGKMTFQGFLTDASSPPVPLGNTSPVNQEVIFKIYNHATAGSVIWAETQIVTVDKGHFSVLLGEGSSVAGQPHSTDLSGVFMGADASDRWLGITLDGAEITPRIQFFAAPYAHLARSANSLVAPSGQANLTVVNGGNVGIGTTGPGTTLDVRSDSPAITVGTHGGGDGALFFGNSAHGVKRSYPGPGNNNVGLYTTDGDIFLSGNGLMTSQFVVKNSGNVGIGTAAPGTLLEVFHNGASTFGVGVNIRAANGNDGARLEFERVGVKAWGMGIHQGINNTTFGIFEDNHFGNSFGTARLAIAPGGNVGIGTVLPDHKLTVIGPDNVAAFSSTGGQAYIRVVDNTGFDNRIELASRGNGRAAIWTGGDHLNVLRNGNVGIGTMAPTARLHVDGPMRIEGKNVLEFGSGIAKQGDAGKIGYQAFGAGALDIVGAGTSVPRNIRLYDRVGIGTSTPAVPLHIVGGAVPHQFQLEAVLGTAGAGDIPNITRNDLPHSIVVDQRIRAASYDVESDARIKQVTRRIPGQDSLETIRQLDVADYVYIDKITHGGRTQRGLIAQEVAKVLPEAVGQSLGVIPNIYAPAASFQFDAAKKRLSVELKHPHDLEIDDVVSLVMGDLLTQAKVMDVASSNSFVIAADKRPARLFVIGKQVKDFRTVDYDLVFTTGISALQELDRQVQALKKSEERIAQLEEKIASFAELEQKAARVDSLEREVAELKRLVAGLAQTTTKQRRARNLAATGDR